MLDFKTWDADVKRNIFTPRSKEFQQLTDAFKAYDLKKGTPTLIALAEALKKWIAVKGVNWRNSTRNKNKLMERLLDDLFKNPQSQNAVRSLMANNAPPKLKVIGMGKMHSAKDADGKWFAFPIQSKENSCGPCSVRIVCKLMTNEDMGEDYLRQLVEEAEEGGGYQGQLGKGGLVDSDGVHDWSANGGGTWMVPQALKALKINGVKMSNSSALINTSKEKPAIGVVEWVKGGLHYVVVAGPLKTKKNTLVVLDPWYGLQEVTYVGSVLNQYSPIVDGQVKSTANWDTWVWKSL